MIGHTSGVGSTLRRATLGIVVTAAVLSGPAAAMAGSAPANDGFGAATQVAFLPFEDASVDNTNATVQNGEQDASCTPSISSTVWYRIDPTSSYGVRVKVLPETGIDPVLAIYEGTSLGSLSWFACVDSGGPFQAETTDIALTGGHTYFIQVGGYAYGESTGEFTVKVRRLKPPANDDFGNATSVALGSMSSATTTSATLQLNEPVSWCGYGVDRTVWYRYTAGSTRTVVANTVGSNFDTVLTVFQGDSLASLNQVTCNDDRGIDVLSKVTLSVVAGETYYFQVGGFGGSSGDLVLRLKAV
jgi:hypothetical protein